MHSFINGDIRFQRKRLFQLSSDPNRDARKKQPVCCETIELIDSDSQDDEVDGWPNRSFALKRNHESGDTDDNPDVAHNRQDGMFRRRNGCWTTVFASRVVNPLPVSAKRA